MSNQDNSSNDESVEETRNQSQGQVEEIQRALNDARINRDQNLKKKTRIKYYHNPANEVDNAPDTRSVMTTATVSGQYRDANGRPMQLVALPAGANIQNLTTGNPDDNSDFSELTYEEIQIDLRLLADIVQDEKLHVSSDGKTIVVDNRVGQTARRWYSGDSRSKTLKFIKHIYNETEKLCSEIVNQVNNNDDPKENTEKLMNLYGLIQASAKGLDRLNMTYSDDKLCAAKIATIKGYFETYCDRTLKGTIEGFKKNL
jgi:hypothetical protein